MNSLSFKSDGGLIVMTILDRRKMRDEKIAQLKSGRTVYAESPEFIRIIKRGIEKENLLVSYEETNTGCWFIPEENGTYPIKE